MTSRPRRLLDHPVARAFVFDRLLLTGSALLALTALATGLVSWREIPGRIDARLLGLFFVLTIAVELGKNSSLFDRLVASAVRRSRRTRTLALALTAVTGLLAMILTNDVALLLVVPFTMLLKHVKDFDPAPIVVLEIASANLVGSATPFGNPQNLFLFSRGGFSGTRFLADQALFVAGAAILIAAAVPLLVPRRDLAPPEGPSFDVDPLRASAFFVLIGAEAAALAGWISWPVPLLLSIPALFLVGRRLPDVDFSLVFVFAFLFVGVAGLERTRLYRIFEPGVLFGHGPTGLLVSAALLSQVVSNVPAAMLLAPAAAGRPALVALLYGVNAGGCGTPIASLANVIGAQLYLKEGGAPGAFWRRFLPVSFALLAGMLAWSLSILRLSPR